MKHSNKKQKKRKHLSTLSSRFLFSILAIVFSLNTVAQTSCVANIDNGNTEICLGSGVVKTFSNAIASGGTIDWISSGDGTFNDPSLPNPTYTAGPNDIANGYVFIYLDVYRDDPIDPCSALPVVILHLSSMHSSATPAAQSVCSGVAITPIVLSGGLSTITYNWARNNTSSIPGIAATGSGTIKGAFANITSAPVTVTFTITPTASTCTGTPITATVVVSPKPIAAASPTSQTICSGATIAPITFSSAISGTIFNWTRNNTSSVTGVAASGSGNITGSLINTTASPVTVTFTITPTANGCTGTAITVTIVVNPSQNIVATPSTQTICSGAAITPITFSGGPYNWTRNNTGSVTGISTSGSGNINGILTNSTSAPATVTFTTWTAGCPGVAAVTVNPIPNAMATPSSQTICSDVMITPIILSGNISGTTYDWLRDNPALVTGIGANGSGDIYCSLSNSGTVPVVMTFVITPTANGCAGSAISSMITVTPRPTSVISGNQAICAGQPLSNISIALTGTAPWSFIYTDGTTPVTVNGTSTNPYTFSPLALPATYTVTSLNDANCIALAGNITGSATLSQSSYTIASFAGANGNIGPNGTTNVSCGNNQTFSITANSCYQIADVLADGVSQGAVSTYTFNNVIAPHIISATFSQIIYTINANAGANGSITPNGATPVNCGGSQVYTITPNAGYNIQNVLVDGASQGIISTYTFSNVTASHTISATFVSSAPGTFTITTNAGANGTITPGGAVSINSGASQTFNIVPNSCYQITDVSVDGVSQGAVSTYTFNSVTATHTISATFSQIIYTINANAGANGSITPNGATPVNCGGSQVYTITPNAGYNIQNVLVDGASQGIISTYTFSNVTASHTISATFVSSAPGTFTITTNAGANGTITPGGAVSINSGASQTFNIVPNSCYQIADVSVDGVSQGAVSTYTFTNVTATHTISATFSQISYTINANAGFNGSITPNGAMPVGCGSTQTFSIAANSCYQIADVTVDGISQGAISTYTFINVTATHTISASFSQISYLITASAGANGAITPAGSTSVNCGTGQAYSIIANTGFIVQTVLVDGVSVGNVNTFTFPNVLAPHTISATFTAVSGCAAPTLSASIANVLCRNGSTGAINVTLSGGTAPFTYAWTGPNNFTATSEDITAVAAGNYRITVTAAGVCTVIGNYFISQPSGTLGTTAPSWNPVLCNGGTTNVVINAVGGTLPYTGTGTISNQLAGAHTYTVMDANGCTTSTTINIIQPTANIATAAAGAVQCGTGTATLTVTATGGTGAKQYSLNGGAFQSGNAFTVTPAGSPYTVTVKDANQCTVLSNSVTIAQPTSSAPPAQPTTITGPTYGLCGGGTFTYSVGTVTGATGYTWAPAAGWTITSGQGTNQMQVTVPSNFTGPSSIGVAAVNSCGTGTQYRVSVFGILYYPGTSISGPSTVIRNQANVQYSLPGTPGTTFTWLVPAGASITSGQGTNSITVNFGTSSGAISVDVQNACGTAPRSSKIVTVAASRAAAPPTPADQILTAERTDFTVYPNPAENNATLVFGSQKAGSKFEIVISNTIGKTLVLKTGITIAGQNMLHFDLNKFTTGMYLVRLITEEGIQIQKLYKR